MSDASLLLLDQKYTAGDQRLDWLRGRQCYVAAAGQLSEHAVWKKKTQENLKRGESTHISRYHRTLCLGQEVLSLRLGTYRDLVPSVAPADDVVPAVGPGGDPLRGEPPYPIFTHHT